MLGWLGLFSCRRPQPASHRPPAGSNAVCVKVVVVVGGLWRRGRYVCRRGLADDAQAKCDGPGGTNGPSLGPSRQETVSLQSASPLSGGHEHSDSCRRRALRRSAAHQRAERCEGGRHLLAQLALAQGPCQHSTVEGLQVDIPVDRDLSADHVHQPSPTPIWCTTGFRRCCGSRRQSAVVPGRARQPGRRSPTTARAEGAW